MLRPSGEVGRCIDRAFPLLLGCLYFFAGGDIDRLIERRVWRSRIWLDVGDTERLAPRDLSFCTGCLDRPILSVAGDLVGLRGREKFFCVGEKFVLGNFGDCEPLNVAAFGCKVLGFP